MTNFIAILTLITQLMPQLIQLIKAIEVAFPEAGQGANKLSVLRSSLEAAYSSFTDAKVSFAEVWPALQKVVAGIVSMYNASGVFKK